MRLVTHIILILFTVVCILNKKKRKVVLEYNKYKKVHRGSNAKAVPIVSSIQKLREKIPKGILENDNTTIIFLFVSIVKLNL
jgi:hypothetical protein